MAGGRVVAAASAAVAVAAYYYLRRKRARELAATFERDGIAVVRGFASVSECQQMLRAMDVLVEEWDPTTTTSVFKTDSTQTSAQGKDDYFMSSGDAVRTTWQPLRAARACSEPHALATAQVRFFLEAGAMDEQTGDLLVPKTEALNKVGHALHVYEPAFAQYAQSGKMRALVHELGWKRPDLVQSMYIFKQPRIGGEVTPHQDSCFLRTDPHSCLGLWLALEDATLDNGCLWARPGSHLEPLRRHFAKQPDGTMGFEPQLSTDAAASTPAMAWEGRMPEGQTPESLGFVALPVRAGDLVLIHGQVDHLSLPNTSGKSRHTFQLHLVESKAAGATWHARNWLQYPQAKPFPQFM